MKVLPYRRWLAALVLAVITALAYEPAWTGGFIWDDEGHITKPGLRSAWGLAQIWTNPGSTQQYYPITHSLFWFEHLLWGDAVLPYHLVGLLLHVTSALLLWRLLRQLEIPGAYLAATIFALHPVQAESVAWISELKNTLSGTFFLASLHVYLRFDQTRKRAAYIGALLLFGAGLLAKSVVAVFPIVLLVIFWWKRGRISWKRDVLALLPFCAASLASGLFTAWIERNYIGAQGLAFHLSFVTRCLIAGRAFWFYLTKLFWPSNLTFIYPRWELSESVWWQYLFPLAALGLLAILWILRRRTRAPLAATLFFAGVLFPALGFVNVYPFIYSFVADHFQYLACIGPITLAAAGIRLGTDFFPRSKAFLQLAVGGLLLLTLATLTWQQCHQYRDLETLWRTTIARNPASWMAEGNLAGLLLEQDRVDEAIAHYQRAIEIWPGHAEAHNNLGNALLRKGLLPEALIQFQKVVEIWPNELEAHNNIGGIFLQTGRLDQAIAEFEKVLALDPTQARAQNNLGNALLQKGEIDQAIAHFEITLALPFDHAETHYNLGNAYLQKGDVEQAIMHYRAALAQRPNHAATENNLGNALEKSGQLTEALTHYRKAAELEPTSLMFQNNLAWMLATSAVSSLRDPARALQLAEQANRSAGENNPAILRTLAAAHAANEQFPIAAAIVSRALALAEAQGNTALAESLRNELALYQINISPFAHSN